MRYVLITGATGGVGKATAEILSENKLLLVGKNEASLKRVAQKVGADYFVCDITIIEQINKLKDYVERNFAKLDTIINCAGVWSKGEISQLKEPHFAELNTLEKIKDVFEVNTFGTIAMVTTFAPILIKNKRGQIINVNSQSAVEVEEFCPVYNSSKHAIYQYRKAVQRDLARHNVKITDVCPGLMKTDFFFKANDELPQEVMKLGLSPNDVAKTIKYVFDMPHEITIPSIEVRHIKNY